MRVETVGDLRKIIEGLDDDYKIKTSVDRNVPDSVLNTINYISQIDSDRQQGFMFSDIDINYKEFCISVTVPDDMCYRIRNEIHARNT